MEAGDGVVTKETVEGKPVVRQGAGGIEDAMKVPFVDLKTQYSSIASEIGGSVSEVLKDCDFILGAKVKAFEREFASYCGSTYSLGVSSGTEALHLALRALGIGPGDEVITQANTFIATALAISYTGATPVFVDVEEETFNIDPRLLEKAVTPRTKAIIPVHLYGRPAPLDAIKEVAARHNLFIVEDACQAHGALYSGEAGAARAGTLGDIAAFSFYPGKNLGAYGDGGAITTGDTELYVKLRMLRDYGQVVKYHHQVEGYNSRLDTIQAAVLSVKLKYLDRWNGLRADHAARYSELLAGIPEVRSPELCEGHVYHLYVIRAQERGGLAEFLGSRGISTGIHYPVPNHLQPAFGRLGYAKGSFPVTERLSGEILSLPIFPELKYNQIRRVADAISDFYGR